MPEDGYIANLQDVTAICVLFKLPLYDCLRSTACVILPFSLFMCVLL